MTKCKKCGGESESYRLCGDCKKEWKRKRLIAYDIVVSEIGEYTYENRKQFRKRLIELENSDI